MPRHSLCETLFMALAINVRTFMRYFVHFLHDREMEHVSKDHTNPMYVTKDIKSWPLASMGCHGMPSGSVMDSMDVMS